MHRRQEVVAVSAETVRRMVLPSPTEEVCPGILWGRFEQLFTPAFWASRAFLAESSGALDSYKIGATLREEVAACLLGGYGIPALVGLLAFERLRDAGALEGPADHVHIHGLLAAPMELGGRPVRYRFAAQKARYLAAALDGLERLVLPQDHRGARDALRTLPGVGYKTASWITRNWWDSDDVAILDVHVCRACVLVGIFPPGSDPGRRYLDLEDRFLGFARAIGVRPARLDNLVWQTMRRVPQDLLREAAGAVATRIDATVEALA
jgi:N-glycosylase/DNA lyase